MNRIIASAYIAVAIVLFILCKWPVERSSPKSFEITGVHFEKQPDSITCGPTSLLMVLELYGKHHSLSEVKNQTKTTWITHAGTDIGMTSPDYAVIALKHFGVKGHMFHGSFSDLKYYVSQKRPTIVLLRSGKSTWHYVVVIGYTPELVILADPAYGARREVPVKHFIDAWNFTSDILGREIVSKCIVCKGTGRIGKVNLGPLNLCDNCGGSGKNPDYALFAVRASDVGARTMIVPNESLVGNTSNSKASP